MIDPQRFPVWRVSGYLPAAVLQIVVDWGSAIWGEAPVFGACDELLEA
ncbi:MULTISPECIES: hypothetical protein [unclassified Pseudomonas]|nr:MULTISPECIES: hypothetical protein [unclassified Pseudomonas]